MKRFVIVLIALVLLTRIAWFEQYDGALVAVRPDIFVTIPESRNWGGGPTSVDARTDDPDGVYVLVPEMPDGEEFAAVRVSSMTGALTSVKIQLGPSSGTRPCLPSDDVRAIVHGVRFQRLAPYLFKLPGDGGPGLEYVDSATGRIDIVFERGGRIRPLLTRRAYNSDRIVEMLAMVSVDPGGRWIAVPIRRNYEWTVAVFRLN